MTHTRREVNATQHLWNVEQYFMCRGSMWTHQWSFQSRTVQSGFVASLLLKWARERYRFDYSNVEQTQFIDPFTASEHGDDYLQAEI